MIHFYFHRLTILKSAAPKPVMLMRNMFPTNQSYTVDSNSMYAISWYEQPIKNAYLEFSAQISKISAAIETKIKSFHIYFWAVYLAPGYFRTLVKNKKNCCLKFKEAQQNFSRTKFPDLLKVLKEHPEYMKNFNKTVVDAENSVNEIFPEIRLLSFRLKSELAKFYKQNQISILTAALSKVNARKKKAQAIEKILDPALAKLNKLDVTSIKEVCADIKKAKDILCPPITEFVELLDKALKGESKEAVKEPEKMENAEKNETETKQEKPVSTGNEEKAENEQKVETENPENSGNEVKTEKPVNEEKAEKGNPEDSQDPKELEAQAKEAVENLQNPKDAQDQPTKTDATQPTEADKSSQSGAAQGFKEKAQELESKAIDAIKNLSDLVRTLTELPQPEAGQATQPVQPEAAQPTQPEAAQTEAAQTTQQEATQPVQPEAAQPTQPESSQPEASQPETAQPEIAQPTQPETAQPTQSEAVQSAQQVPQSPQAGTAPLLQSAVIEGIKARAQELASKAIDVISSLSSLLNGQFPPTQLTTPGEKMV